jgi:hypothetical protein
MEKRVKLYDTQRVAIINGLINLNVLQKIVNKVELIEIIRKTKYLICEEE